MYYVYEWYIIETEEIIYVGKGSKRRYKVRKHNRLFNEMLKRFQCESRIIKYFNTEKEAFDFEFDYINKMRNLGQCVCNIHNGGYGGTTDWWTDKLRKKYSEYNVMKSEAQRKRMSENNPMKNKDISKKVNEQKRKPVIIGEHEYSSVKEACEMYNTSSDVIATWCKKGINIHGEKCRYKDSKQVEFSGKRYNKGGSRAVIFEGVEYECAKDFSKAINISSSAAYAWLKRGYSPKGTPCRYVDDKRELVFVDRYVARNKSKARSIIINDIIYSSVDEASKLLNIPKSTIYSYLQGKRKSSKYICKYGNQQPSHGNTDNSTVEGSTTNG